MLLQSTIFQLPLLEDFPYRPRAFVSSYAFIRVEVKKKKIRNNNGNHIIIIALYCDQITLENILCNPQPENLESLNFSYLTEIIMF